MNLIVKTDPSLEDIKNSLNALEAASQTRELTDEEVVEFYQLIEKYLQLKEGVMGFKGVVEMGPALIDPSLLQPPTNLKK